jgi:hypothetical protein
MEAISVLRGPATTVDKKVRSNINKTRTISENSKRNQVTDNRIAEVDENFQTYLNYHGLANEDKLLVLSSTSHYYYDYDELKEITTLINLKKLNLVKHLDDFLRTLRDGLSPKTNFIGCFTDCKSPNGESTASRLYKRFINFLDAKTDYEIDRNDFSRLLESCGFKVIDMKEINGLTYFRTQN